MKWLMLMSLVLSIAGCHAPPVRCDSHLTPINAVAKSQAVPKAAMESAR